MLQDGGGRTDGWTDRLRSDSVEETGGVDIGRLQTGTRQKGHATGPQGTDPQGTADTAHPTGGPGRGAPHTTTWGRRRTSTRACGG